MKHRYLTADVFTSRAFGGNPLAVFPDAREIPAELMQPIAREFNYSETTFVLPPDDPSHTARVRIFTPGGELQFAGHPTVGTAFLGEVPLQPGLAEAADRGEIVVASAPQSPAAQALERAAEALKKQAGARAMTLPVINQ